jgi:cytochrome c-type biogenesis protein CcmH
LAAPSNFLYGQPMIVFWIAAALLSALAAALVLHRAALLARRPAADPTVEVYRRQLGEIDDLADRGLLAEGERRLARAEAARRLLGAADEAQARAREPAVSRPVRLWVLAVAVAGPLLALGLYAALGSPGLPDQPFAARLAQWRAVADPSQLTAPQLVAVLQDVVKRRPADVEGRLLLARTQAVAGDLPGAVQSLKTASRIAPGDADVWAALGEALVEQGQGNETPAAVDAFHKALAIDPQAAAPRYHLGRAKLMTGDLNGGLADWRALVPLLSSAEQKQTLQQQIDETQKAGRLVESQPAPQPAQAQAEAQPAAAGPTADQVAAAQQAQAGASPASQRAYIQSMVDAMAAKLRAHPHDAQGWALLIHSYGVLGETDKRAQARAQARALFKGDAAALKAIDEAQSGAP